MKLPNEVKRRRASNTIKKKKKRAKSEALGLGRHRCGESTQPGVNMACKLEACAECTQKCLLVHGKKRNSSPNILSFFKVMIGNHYSEILFLPPKFCPVVSSLIGQKILLEDSTGQQWKVTVSNLNGSLAFQEGWNAFSSHHKLEIGDFLVFYYILGSHFFVQIYDRTGCEKIDLSLNRNQRKRGRTTRNFNVGDGQYYTTDKSSMNKQGSSTSAFADVEISQNQCMNDVENVIAKVTSNCELSRERPAVASKAECLEDPCFFIDRNFGKQVENRCPVFDLSCFEMLENNCGTDKSDKIKVGDDASLRSQIEDVLVNKYLVPVVEEVVNLVVPSDVSDADTIKNNDVEMIEKMVNVSNNCNSKFSENLQYATAITPEKNGGNSSNSSNGVLEGCHIPEEKSRAQSKSWPEIDQLMAPKMDFSSFADINQRAQLKINENSGEYSIPIISGMQNCQVGKLPPLFKVDCGQSSDVIVRENATIRVMKTETLDSVPTTTSTAANISCVIASDCQHFLELPTCLPTSFKGRFKRERMVVLLRDPDMRMWPVLYHEKSGFKILTSGWEAFSKANNIQLGDECVFGAETDSESIYGVRIIRN